MDSTQAELILIVDRSGSMSTSIGDLTRSLWDVLDTQCDVPVTTLVTLVQFDHEIEELATRTRLARGWHPVFTARGNTALNDAVARTVISAGARLAALPEDQRPATVTVVIITDGFENASTEYAGPGGTATVKALNDHQQQLYGWQYLYLGANQDAVTVGGTLGIPQDHSLTYAATSAGYAASGSTVANFVTRSTVGQQYRISPEERVAAIAPGPAPTSSTKTVRK